MQTESGRFSPSIIAWLVATLTIVVLTGRGDLVQVPLLKGFWWMAGFYAAAIFCYVKILQTPENKRFFRMAVAMAILVRMGLVFTYPNLSDDFYRYIWDGRLWLEGVNPFDLRPSEWMAQLSPDRIGDWQYLYDHLNSKEYYTVYPPVLQGVFAFTATVAQGDIYLSLLVMKGTILLAELGTIYLLVRIVTRLNLPRNAVLIYALNPMVVVELMGNGHWEALMIVFFLATFWFLMKWGILPAAPFLALAIGSKLLPVLVFPFLVRRLGWVRSLGFGVLVGVCCLPLFWYLLDGVRGGHFLESLRLYFQSFEFNGGLYYSVRALLGDWGYWANRVLPWLMLGLILLAAWKERNRVWSGLPAVTMIALTLYQLHSPVVHPWYITPLVALAALEPYRYPVVWSFVLPLTYVAYFRPPGVQESTVVLVVEYGLLFGYMAYEWIFRRQRLTLTAWMLRRPRLRRLAQRSIPARLRIKQERIARHLRAGEKILDIGTGNGGLCRALRQEGLDVTPVDVADLSFFPEVKPWVYEGQVLPFVNKSFDVSLLITMLHHTPNPEQVIREAMRVTNGKLVIMEDIYRNGLQKHLTFFTDSLVNLEFEGHPHTNKTDTQWQALFREMGLRLVFREEFRTLVFFRQVVYVVEVAALPPAPGLVQ